MISNIRQFDITCLQGIEQNLEVACERSCTSVVINVAIHYHLPKAIFHSTFQAGINFTNCPEFQHVTM